MGPLQARRLQEIADRLDELAVEERHLYEERVALWSTLRADGTTLVELGRLSRVSPITIRQLIARSR